LGHAAGGYCRVTIYGRNDRRAGKIGGFHVTVDVTAGESDPGGHLDREIHIDIVVVVGAPVVPAAPVAAGRVPLIRIYRADDDSVSVLINPDLHRGRVAAAGMLDGLDPYFPPARTIGRDRSIDAPDLDGLARGHGA